MVTYSIPDAALNGNGYFIDTRATAVAQIIPAAVNAVILGGYNNVGDFGGGLWKRLGADPANGTGFQDASGAWFGFGGDTVTPQMFGAFGNNTNCTTALQTMLNNWKNIYWPKDSNTYLFGSLFVASNTRIQFAENVSLTIRATGSRAFYILAVTDVKLIGNKTSIDGTNAGDHPILVSGSDRVEITGFNINKSGAAGDCIYVGANGGVTCTDVHIHDNVLTNATRNGITVAGCYGFIIERNSISGAVAAPGAGIDIEANAYNNIGRGIIRNNKIFSNGVHGVSVTFGDDVQIYENEIYSNGTNNIVVGAGSKEFAVGTARPNVDIIAVSAIDAATGLITLSAPVAVGTWFRMTTRSGGVLPATFSAASGIAMSYSMNAGGTQMLASITTLAALTALSDAGSGTLTNDPTTSAIYLEVWVSGQASNLKIHNNKLYDAGADNIRCNTSVDVDIYENDITPRLNKGGIRCDDVRNISIYNNRVFGTSSFTTATGITINNSSYANVYNNYSSYMALYGYNSTSAFKMVFTGNVARNCGHVGGYSYTYTNCRGTIVSNNRALNDPDNSTVAGFGDAGGTTIFQFQLNGNYVSPNSASSIITSYNLLDTSHVLQTNIYYDGNTYEGRFNSVTYNPPNLVAGATVSTTIAVTGAAVGDLVQATHDQLGTNGIVLRAYVSVAGTVTVVFMNPTTGAIDIASGTLTVKVTKV